MSDKINPVAINRSLSETCYEHDLRIEMLFHLGSMCYDPSFPSHVVDAFTDDLDSISTALNLSLVNPDDSDTYPVDEFIAEILLDNHKLGFLACFATPVITNAFSETSYSTYGWGMYTTKWLYGETLEEAFKQAIEWQKGYKSKRLAKLLAEKQ